jgi:predicted N-acetyltransferase YhbS
MIRYVPWLSPAQVEEACRHTHAFWGGGRSLAAHTANVRRQLETAGPEVLRYVGLVERGRLVGSIKRYGLALRDGAGPVVRAVGIGAVFTPPSARGRGIGSLLVTAVMNEARDLGYAAAALYSDIDPAFYERLGFVALGARDFRLPAGALPARGALGVRAAVPADEGQVLLWHEQAWARQHRTWLRPARTPALYRYFRLRNRVDDLWILKDGAREVGYLMAGPDDPRRDLPDPRPPRLLWFDEAAAPGVPRERVWATVAVLARRAKATSVQGWRGPEGAPEGAETVARPSAFPMIAPLAPTFRVRPRRAWLDSFQHY